MIIQHKFETPELLFLFASAFATVSTLLMMANRFDVARSLPLALLIATGVTLGVAFGQRLRH
jgi:hypothetical protein